MSSKKVKPRYNEWKRVKDTQVAHLAGVIDAIGTISLQVIKSDSYKFNYTLRPRIQFHRPTKDDPILGKTLAYCDENGVKVTTTEKSHEDYPNKVLIKISDKGSIERFLQPMMDYLVTDYFRAELMLNEVLPALRDGKHDTKQGFYDMVALSEALQEGRTKGRQSKYTQEYFAEEWSLPE